MDLSRPSAVLQWDTVSIPFPSPDYSSPGFCTAVLVGKTIVVTGRLTQRSEADDEDELVASAVVIDYEEGSWHWVNENGPALYGASSYLIGDKMYSLGGLDAVDDEIDLWAFDTVLLKWEPIPAATSPKFLETIGHSAVYVEQLDVAVVFGGYRRNLRRYTRELWILSANGHSWANPNAKGLPPSPRAGMGTVLVGKDLYLYGGLSRTRMYKSLYILHCHDRTRFAWSKPKTRGESPEYSAGCTMNYLQGRLIVFGGTDGTWQGCNELYLYDLTEDTWTQAETNYHILEHPPATFGHCAVMSSKGLIIVGGAFNDAGRFFVLRSVDATDEREEDL